jgi:hypothetical protein
MSSNKLDKFFDINDNTKKERSKAFDLFRIILVLCINFFIFYWLIKVHKCKCANIDEGLYLKEWYLFKIIYILIILIYLIFQGSYDNSKILMVVSIIIMIIEFIMIIRLLIYIHKLRKIKCNCGMSVQQNIIYYYYIVIFSIFLFFILTSLLFSIISFISTK